MPEYISREAVLKELCEIMNYNGSRIAKDVPLVLVSKYQMEHVIRKFPAAKVAPVVHGKWETEHTVSIRVDMDKKEATTENGTSVLCSECRSYPLLDGMEVFVLSNFCPNCGAKMKEDADNE